MIDPKDIFNAHRVVNAPSAFRKRSSRPPMILPKAPALTNPERRGVTLRSVKRAAIAQRDSIRQIAVRHVIPKISKPPVTRPNPRGGIRYGFDDLIKPIRRRRR